MLYAILQFIANSIPAASRWFPVFERYLKQVAGRVKGFGGEPGLIPPSGIGALPRRRGMTEEESSSPGRSRD